jgi:TatD DNase family protein
MANDTFTLIDSHAHLFDPKIEKNLPSVLQRAFSSSISHIVNIATSKEQVEKAKKLKKEYPTIALVGATTPHDAEKEGEQFFSFFEMEAREKNLDALGETGLDYHYFANTKEIKKNILIRYFELAKTTQLPIVIHCREAFADLFALADRHYGLKQVILHCFTGGEREVEEALSRGWNISISGIVTYPNAKELQKAVKKIPLTNLLIESDCPYLSPQSKRNLVNEPAYIVETAKKIAELLELPIERVADTTSTLAKKLFWQKR